MVVSCIELKLDLWPLFLHLLHELLTPSPSSTRTTPAPAAHPYTLEVAHASKEPAAADRLRCRRSLNLKICSVQAKIQLTPPTLPLLETCLHSITKPKPGLVALLYVPSPGQPEFES